MKKDIKLILLLVVTINYSLLAELIPYRSVIYYSNWSIGSKYYPSSMEAKAISHINFAFMDMDKNGDLKLADEYKDFQTVNIPELKGLKTDDPYAGVIGALSVLKVKYPHLKLGISVGGWSKSAHFHEVAQDKSKRQNFAKNIAKFIDYIGFDFVDIDWEHPTVSRDGCPGDSDDTENFTLLMKELRNELDKLDEKYRKHFELSIAMSAELDLLPTIEYNKVLKIVDFVNLMTYDLAGSWNKYTAHQTPLYTNDAYNHKTMHFKNSADAAIEYFRNTYGDSIDYKRILIGVAAYTRGWGEVKDDGTDENNPGLYASAATDSAQGSDGSYDGIFSFAELDDAIEKYELEEYFDDTAKAAYYYSAKKGYFFTCDNEKSVKAKGKYVTEKKIGGLIMWMASQDRENKLKKAIFNSMYDEDYEFPKQDQIYSKPDVDVKISETDNGYKITIINNEALLETNTALKYAEKFQKCIVHMKLYIKTESRDKFGKGSMSGTVTNEDGIAIIDPSSYSEAKNIAPGDSYTFKVEVSGTPDVDDIISIKMTQRILPSLDEFKEQTIYSK